MTEAAADTRVGPYRISHLLGAGGMGEVYAAHSAHLGQVALKLLSPAIAQKPQLKARFMKEARILATIDHPGVVRVLDWGVFEDGAPYLAMELLDGIPLRRRIRAGSLSAADAVRIATQIARCMACVHPRVVHRDLKPDNIMLVGDLVKVFDFGIAKADLEPADLPQTSVQTSAEARLGTATYMAPEQCHRSSAITGQADVYALGITLFEMLAGRPPFLAADEFLVMAMHVRDAPPELGTLAPSLPEMLCQLVGRMLHKEPARRPSMEQVAVALAELNSDAVPRQRRRRVGLLLWGALALSALTGGGVAWHRGSVRPDPAAVRRELGVLAQANPGTLYPFLKRCWKDSNDALNYGTVQQAAAVSQDSAAVLKMLTAEQRESAAARAAQALQLIMQGDVAKYEGRLDDALADYGEAREFDEDDQQQDGAAPDRERSWRLAIIHDGLGDVLLHRGQGAAAAEHYQLSLNQQGGLLAHEGGRASDRHVDAMVYWRLAEAALQGGQFDQAQTWYGQALGMEQGVRAEDPMSAAWTLSRIYRGLSEVHRRQGRPADEDARQAHRFARDALDGDPGSHRYVIALAQAEDELGHGAQDRARQVAFVHSLETAQALLDRDPDNGPVLHAVIEAHVDLAQAGDASERAWHRAKADRLLGQAAAAGRWEGDVHLRGWRTALAGYYAGKSSATY